MDVDFPLLLTVAVLVCGIVWLIDVVAFKPRRAKDAPEPKPVEYARSFFPVLLIVLLLRSFLAEPYRIPSESMLPTLEVGDFILVNKYAYGLRLPVIGTKILSIGEPERGDVMVFVPPHEPRYFIKRVIGVPGDRLVYRDQTLTINGEPLPTELVDEITIDGRTVRVCHETLGGRRHTIYRYPGYFERPFERVVPEDHYFMMGDNRGASDDSRDWGFASDHNVVGKAVAIWMHKEPGLNWPTFARNGAIE
jgi:signal peptidase I